MKFPAPKYIEILHADKYSYRIPRITGNYVLLFFKTDKYYVVPKIVYEAVEVQKDPSKPVEYFSELAELYKKEWIHVIDTRSVNNRYAKQYAVKEVCLDQYSNLLMGRSQNGLLIFPLGSESLPIFDNSDQIYLSNYEVEVDKEQWEYLFKQYKSLYKNIPLEKIEINE